MFLDEEAQKMRVISVLELSWGSGRKYAKARPFHALSFRVFGDAVFEHGEAHHVHSGDIAYVPQGYDYIHSHGEEHLYVVHFEMADDRLHDYFSVTPADTGRFQRLFEKMFGIWQGQRPGCQFAATSVFYTILSELQKELVPQQTFSSSDKMNTVIEYINAHYADGALSVSALAAMYGTSETYFRSQFKKTMNLTPLKYIHELRLKYAAELIHTGYYSVAEVAYKAGFNDPKYFSRFVKKLTSRPPSKL